MAATFVEAIYRLAPRAIDVVRSDLDGPGWAGLVASVAGLGYYEGYRALWRRFAPAVATRAWETARTARTPGSVAVAPLAALRLLGAPPREVGRAWIGVALIFLAVLVVRRLPAPHRGIVDAGVVVALSIGLVALIRELPRGARRGTGATGGPEAP